MRDLTFCDEVLMCKKINMQHKGNVVRLHERGGGVKKLRKEGMGLRTG